MNEAIRRSLQDLMISNKEAKDDKAQKKPSEDVDVETDAEENVVVANDKPEPSAPVEDNETGGATPVVETVTEEEEKEIEVAKSETKPSADDNASQASLTKEPGYNLFAREQRLKIREEHSEFTFVQITEEQRSRWKALSDEEKAEYKNLSTVIPMPSSPVAAAVEVPLPTSPSFASGVSVVKGDEKEDLEDEKEKVRESSFSTDAAGNGDVADLLGSTLDRCAEAIDAMVSELERTASNDESDGDSYDSSYVGVTEEGEEQDAETTENGEDEDTNGATILESTSSPGEEQKEEESQTKEERSEDGWQVVSDDNHINGDEELARAAQMVGSALFNSDMKSSGEVLSTLTGSAAGSDAFSQASSVPTSVPSLNYVSAAQLQRWAPQLTQLHEMGFDDDALCVEILERLSAANIGVGDDEEISVQQVVNQLWKS